MTLGLFHPTMSHFLNNLWWLILDRAGLKLLGWLYVVVFVYWPLACAVWPNHEVVEFQPHSVTTPILVSVTYFYIAIIIVPLVCPSYYYTYLQGRFLILTCWNAPPFTPLHGSIRKTERPLSPSQNTDYASSLHRVLCSPDHRLSPMQSPLSAPWLSPPTTTPAGFLFHTLPCVFQNIF